MHIQLPIPMRSVLISALALLGCGSRTEDWLMRPRPLLSMTPPDLTSAVGTTPLQVAIDNHAEAVGGALLAPIAGEVALVSWPEGAPVPVTTELHEFEPRRENGFEVSGSGTVTVMPGAPLEDRWYFLYVASAPAAVDLAGAPRLKKLADGRVGVRFTVGSDPRMTWIRRCLGEGMSGKVVVDFSETVVLHSAEALAVEAPDACSRPSSGDREDSGQSFTFLCDTLASDTPIRVLVATTVTGIGGGPVRGAGQPVDFPPASFAATGDCPIAPANPE